MATLTLLDFVAALFDHPVEEWPWYRRRDTPPERLDSALVAQYLAEMFEEAGRLLAPYSTAQVAQGLDYYRNYSRLGYQAMFDKQVPEMARLRVVRSVVPLFEQVMAPRCLPEGSNGKNLYQENPLNGVCYMWWDGIWGKPDAPDRLVLDATRLQTMMTMLSIPHNACRESALHGLGHWQMFYPIQVASIIDQFLETFPDLPRSLLHYALDARRGQVL